MRTDTVCCRSSLAAPAASFYAAAALAKVIGPKSARRCLNDSSCIDAAA